MVHAKVEEVRLVAPVGPQGRDGHPADVHVPVVTAVQPSRLQTCTLGRIDSGSLRAVAFGTDRALQSLGQGLLSYRSVKL